MRALHRYFVNPFDARGISLSELEAFATDHYQRMRAQNRDGALDNRLRTLHQLVAAHQATIGDTPVELAAALVAQWDEIYRQSESATGTKSRTESELRRARRALQWELYRNLLRLVELHPRQPEAYASTCSPTCSSGGNGRIRAGKARLKRVRSRGEEGWVG